MKFLIFANVLVLFSVISPASPRIQEGQLILRISGGMTIKDVAELPGVADVEVLVPDLNIYLAKLEGSVMSARASLKNFRVLPQVAWAQLDHVIVNRLTPNDREFEKQWSLHNKNRADVHTTEAWDITTGGKDKNGNDIVVAIVDGGIEISHDELADNIWVNTKEVPNNGVDDDSNGYIDDIHGWNAFTDQGEVTPDDHATHIAGIMGAKTNNAKSIAGINWNVKIMTVDRSGTTSVVVKAYGYVLRNKVLWLETAGQKGANIVATNSSFGIDYGNCKLGSYPAWNDMYNEMGRVGIISAAATANLDIDIDEKGDVPTGCDSPYLISVTNTTDTDKKQSVAAYGKTTIDLGAPGTDILSTITRNNIAKFSGTSMATPHVAGGVALIHAAASKEFADYYLKNPGSAALKIKEMILSSVDKINDLKNRSVSGGRLNLARAAQMASEYLPNRN